MSDELTYLTDLKSAEKKMQRFMTRRVRKDLKHAVSDTKHLISDAKHSTHDKELKDDELLERDIYELLHDLIRGFRRFIAAEKDLVKAESVQGVDAVKIHDRHKGEIENELAVLIRELRAIREIENKI